MYSRNFETWIILDKKKYVVNRLFPTHAWNYFFYNFAYTFNELSDKQISNNPNSSTTIKLYKKNIVT